LPGLPLDIIEVVAEYLPSPDIKSLADTCQTLRYTLAEKKRGALLIMRAQRFRTSRQASELLREIQTHISSPFLQAEALAAFVRTGNRPRFRGPLNERDAVIQDIPVTLHTATFGRMAMFERVRERAALAQLKRERTALVERERQALFDSAWTAITQLPLQYQTEPLEAFAPTLLRAPRSDRLDAVLHQITQLPPQLRSGPLTAFALHLLHGSGRPAVYDAVFAHVALLPAEHRQPVLATLASALLDQSEPAGKFNSFLEVTRHLPAQDQGPMLAKLAPLIVGLPENDQPAAFDRAMQRVEQLAPDQRPRLLQAFARQIPRMAQPARAAASNSVSRVNGGPLEVGAPNEAPNPIQQHLPAEDLRQLFRH
jgi:hypothetical protein